MARKILFLNLLLLAGIVLVGQSLVTSWEEFRGRNNVHLIVREALQGPAQTPVFEVPQPEGPASFPDYLVVAQKNLFSPERQPDSEEEVAEAAPTPPPLPQKPVMNGLSVINGERKALVTVFEGNNPQGDVRMVGVGDAIQGYVVSQISDTSLTLQWNDFTVLVDMMEGRPPQQASAVPRGTPAVTVITVGSPVAAVETTGAERGGGEDKKGIQVSVVGAAAQPGLQRGAGMRGPGQNPGLNPQGRPVGDPTERGLPATMGIGYRPPEQGVPPN